MLVLMNSTSSEGTILTKIHHILTIKYQPILRYRDLHFDGYIHKKLCGTKVISPKHKSILRSEGTQMRFQRPK